MPNTSVWIPPGLFLDLKHLGHSLCFIHSMDATRPPVSLARVRSPHGKHGSRFLTWQRHLSSWKITIREIKLDVTWSYVKRQTAKMTSEFVFFSSNPSLNHIKIEKCLLLFATNANIFTLLLRELKTDGKSFIFAVCSYTYDHVTANLISLITRKPQGSFIPRARLYVIVKLL